MKKILELLSLMLVISSLSFADMENAKELNLQGEKYYKNGNYEKAEDYFFEAFLADRHFTQAASNLGLLYMKEKNFDKAIYWSEEAWIFEKKYGNNKSIIANSLYNKARALEEKGLYILAYNTYEKAYEYNNNESYTKAMKRLNEKIAIKEQNEKKAKDINLIGEKQYHNGNYKSAIETYLEALTYDESNGLIWSNLALAYLRDDNFYGSQFASIIAIITTNDNTIKANSYYNLAKMYEESGMDIDAYLNYTYANETNSKEVYKKSIKRMEEKLKM